MALCAATCSLRDGVLEAHGPGVAWWFDRIPPMRRVAAMTLGHVVLGRDRAALDGTRAHEREHVRQCERWGPLFLPAYGYASLAAWRRSGNAYVDNVFERQARHRSSAPDAADA